MQLNAYVIFDSKSRIYNKPFYFVNDETAIRSCSEVLLDHSSEIALHPEDFSLFKIGVYDDETANLAQDGLQVLARFHELLPPSPPVDVIKDKMASLEKHIHLLDNQITNLSAHMETGDEDLPLKDTPPTTQKD